MAKLAKVAKLALQPAIDHTENKLVRSEIKLDKNLVRTQVNQIVHAQKQEGAITGTVAAHLYAPGLYQSGKKLVYY